MATARYTAAEYHELIDDTLRMTSYRTPSEFLKAYLFRNQVAQEMHVSANSEHVELTLHVATI